MYKTFMGASALLAAGLMSSTALGATLSVVGGSSIALPSNFSLPAVASVGDPVTAFTSATKTAANGLLLDGPARITFEFLGSEAGFTNVFVFGSELFNNKTSTVGDMSLTFDVAGGFVPFSFVSNGVVTADNSAGFSTGLRVAFTDVSSDGSSVIALFDDTFPDVDYDDLAVRITVSEIPLPTTALLLASAMAGVGFLSMRRERA